MPAGNPGQGARGERAEALAAVTCSLHFGGCGWSAMVASLAPMLMLLLDLVAEVSVAVVFAIAVGMLVR